MLRILAFFVLLITGLSAYALLPVTAHAQDFSWQTCPYPSCYTCQEGQYKARHGWIEPFYPANASDYAAQTIYYDFPDLTCPKSEIHLQSLTSNGDWEDVVRHTGADGSLRGNITRPPTGWTSGAFRLTAQYQADYTCSADYWNNPWALAKFWNCELKPPQFVAPPGYQYSTARSQWFLEVTVTDTSGVFQIVPITNDQLNVDEIEVTPAVGCSASAKNTTYNVKVWQKKGTSEFKAALRATDCVDNTSSPFSYVAPLVGKSKITLAVESQPKSERNFKIYGAFGNFLLDNPAVDDNDGVPQSVNYLVATGEYFFNESVPYLWFLKEITCSKPERVTLMMDMAGVKFAPLSSPHELGDEITCTFVNEQATSLFITSYRDRNNDGAYDPSDPVLPHVWTSLYDGTGKIIYGNFTNSAGEWNLLRLRPGGTYIVCQTIPSGLVNTGPGVLDPAFGRPCYRFTAQPAQLYEAEFGYGDRLPARGVGVVPAAQGGLRVIDNFIDTGADNRYGAEDYPGLEGFVLEYPPQLFLPQLNH